MFDSAGGREPVEAGGGEAWTWKELLSSMDEPTPSEEDEAATLIGEIESMGIDTAALLPRPRMDEIVGAVRAGDSRAALDVVRRLAPAAIRRLSRRMAADRRMRAQAERYVRRHQGLLDQAILGGDRGATAALVGSDQGRAFLLLEAALGDVA